MAQREMRMSCRRAEVLMEAHLDGELPPRYRAAFDAHLAGCFGCQREVEHARRVREALRALPERFLDDAVTRRVQERLAAEPRPKKPVDLGTRLRRWWGGRLVPGWQPMAAALAVLVVVVGLAHFLTRPPQEQQFTRADVRRAELQVQWLLAHLGEVSRQTTEVVKKDVIEDHVVSPTARATQSALDDALGSSKSR
jgi:anti-sigma factor RsiW